jgi:hypothetical protein
VRKWNHLVSTFVDRPVGRDSGAVRPTGTGVPAASTEDPFFYSVASHLHRVLHLPRESHLSIWKRVLDLYAQSNKALPEMLQCLCQPGFVEDLMENEVFWGMVGMEVNRSFYAHATEFLPAVYSTAALMAARKDQLPLSNGDSALLTANLS